MSFFEALRLHANVTVCVLRQYGTKSGELFLGHSVFQVEDCIESS
jgi:hypothetical protein